MNHNIAERLLSLGWVVEGGLLLPPPGDYRRLWDHTPTRPAGDDDARLPSWAFAPNIP